MGMDFVVRIDESLKKNGKKRAEMLRDLNLPRNAVSNWYEHGNIPAGDICAKIADYLQVDTHWLITGVDASKISAEEQELLQKWRILTDAEKNPIEVLINNYYQEHKKNLFTKIKSVAIV